MAFTPLHVVKIIETVTNYMDIDLAAESLSPSSEMGRTENVELLKQLIEKMIQVKYFSYDVEGCASDVTPIIAKPSQLPSNPSSVAPLSTAAPVVESLQGHLKILLKYSLNELKQRADFCGFLKKHKKQKALSKWNQRFCVLCEGVFLYFESDKETSKCKGFLVLGTYKFRIPRNTNGFTFDLEACDKSAGYTFQADHKKDVESWKYHLSKVTDQEYTNEEISSITTMIKELTFAIEYGDGEEISDDLIHVHPSILDEGKQGTVSPLSITSATLPLKQTPTEEEFYEVIPAVQSTTSNSILMSNTDSVTQIPLSPLLSSPKQFWMSNLYMGVCDCDAGINPQELSFKCGDVMYVMDKADMNWWIAHHINGSTGLVPRNFITEAYEGLA